MRPCPRRSLNHDPKEDSGDVPRRRLHKRPSWTAAGGGACSRRATAGRSGADPRCRLVAQPTGVQVGRPELHGAYPPVVLGLDVAGVVVAVGPGVTGLAVGDAVAAMADLNGNGGWI